MPTLSEPNVAVAAEFAELPSSSATLMLVKDGLTQISKIVGISSESRVL